MSSEDFKSLIVTDPDLIDEGIDVSNLRTQTNTNPRLLGAIEDYPGISYDPTSYSYLSDLNRLYASGLPEIDTSQPTTPAPPSGGGEGGGGGGTTPTQPDSIGGFDPGVVPGPSGFIGLDPEYDLDPRDYVDDYEYSPFTTTSSDPFLASGAAGGARLPSTSPQEGFLASGAAGGARLPTDMGIMVEDFSKPFDDFLGRTGERVSYPGNQSGIIKDAVDPQAVKTILGPDGITYDAVTGQPIYEDLDAQAAATDVVTEQDLADDTGLLQKLGLPADFNLKKAAIEAGINLVAGVPITLIAKGLEAILPDRDPRQNALDEMYDVKDGTIQSGLMKGYNPVSGGFPGISEPTYGLQDAYQKRIDTINKTLGGMTLEQYQNTDLVQRKKDLEEAMAKEKAMLDQLQYGDPEKIAAGIQTADDDSGSEMLDTSTGVNPFADIDTGVGEFDTTPVTGVTRPGTIPTSTGPIYNETTGNYEDADGNIIDDPNVVQELLDEVTGADYKIGIADKTTKAGLDSGFNPFTGDELTDDQKKEIEKGNYQKVIDELTGVKPKKTSLNTIDTGDDKPQGPGPSGFVGLDKDMDVDPFEFDDMNYEPPAPPSPPTGTDRPGGDDRDDSPAPSAPKGPTTGTTKPGTSSAPYQDAIMRGQTGGGGGGGGGCFLTGTLVTMADGSTKEVQKVDLGDNVAEGGKVFATGKFLVENLHDYKGIKVSGSHMVNENNNWVRVEDSKHGKSLGNNEHTVYVFGSENRRILINDILFTDYFETTEQEKLINDEKDFFNNWKTYENKIDQDNINILNAS